MIHVRAAPFLPLHERVTIAVALVHFFIHWCKGLFCASLVPTFTVSASSARVALVALTVGLMALFHLPGLSPVDFYQQSQ